MRYAIMGLAVGAVVIVIGFGIVAREIYLRNAASNELTHEAESPTPSVALDVGDQIVSLTAVGSAVAVQIRRSGQLRSQTGEQAAWDELWIVKASNGKAQLVVGRAQ